MPAPGPVGAHHQLRLDVGGARRPGSKGDSARPGAHGQVLANTLPRILQRGHYILAVDQHQVIFR